MLNLFFPLVVFAFLVGYFFFSLYKTNKSKHLLCEKAGYPKLAKKAKFNFYSTILLLCISFVTALVFTFLPKLYASLCFQVMDNAFINNAGMVMIKNSFVILVVTGFQASTILHSNTFKESLLLAYKTEALLLFTVLLLNLGVFLFISTLGSLVVFILSLLLFLNSVLAYLRIKN